MDNDDKSGEIAYFDDLSHSEPIHIVDSTMVMNDGPANNNDEIIPSYDNSHLPTNQNGPGMEKMGDQTEVPRVV